MTGKVKEVYKVDDDTLEFAYTDNISVFDKIIPSKVPHKGETLCRTAKVPPGQSDQPFLMILGDGLNNFVSDSEKVLFTVCTYVRSECNVLASEERILFPYRRLR